MLLCPSTLRETLLMHLYSGNHTGQALSGVHLQHWMGQMRQKSVAHALTVWKYDLRRVCSVQPFYESSLFESFARFEGHSNVRTWLYTDAAVKYELGIKLLFTCYPNAIQTGKI
jgi:hypothetical protein